MALQLVLESFSAHVANDDWKFRAGELVEDGVAPVSGQAIVPIVALRAAGLAYIPYVVGTMAVMLGVYLAEHGRDDDPPSLASWLLTYSIALTALTPLTGIVNPNAVVTGLFGQTYYNSASGIWYNCTSNPTGTAWSRDDDTDPGSVACFQIIQAGVPVAAEVLSIGADDMEADGAGANINFVIAGAEATMDNLLAAWIANGVELFFADKLSATTLRFRSAATHQGVIVSADPNVALTEAMTNYIFDCGNVNVNTLGGRAAGVRTPCYAEVVINAGHVASGRCRISFPGAVLAFTKEILTTTGVVHAVGTDTFTIANGDVLITLTGGGAPQLVAGDIVKIVASY